MRLLLALLLATTLATVVHLNQIKIKPDQAFTDTDVSLQHDLQARDADPEKRFFRELGRVALSSLGYVLLPVLVGYSLLRLLMTYQRFLFTLAALFVLAIAFVLLSGFFDVQIRFDKIGAFLQTLRVLFFSIGWIRSTSALIGAFFGIRAYRAEQAYRNE